VLSFGKIHARKSGTSVARFQLRVLRFPGPAARCAKNPG
jgi:hypothetical protein